ncbi:MAG: aldehyde dehydrogenase family protein [Spirochaetaceae bacterium]|jgi:succinate-semialdehyde dehydrogenase/glutarate-semialdehyde dehydrogenase|nr:aldehyde dehydrogenase family protein [Spirochaetaceae bacterium]
MGTEIKGKDEQETAASLAAKIAEGRAAQSDWAARPCRERAACLRKSVKYLGSHIDEITEIIHRENGKLKTDALAAEVLPALMAARYYIRMSRRFCAPGRTGGGSLLMFNKRSRLVYKPYGVVGIISPWNYPFAIPFSEVMMALLAGNAVILKTASLTPGVGRMLEALFNAAELPDGLFSYVEMPGSEAGPAFIRGGVDKLFFTGSSATGRELMALAAERLLPLVLELGGSDAAIICDDADTDRAAWGVIWAGFSNAGQSCGGVQRILIHEKIYGPFLEKFCALVRELKPGDGLGPMATLRHKEVVQQQIDACLASGAKIAVQSDAWPTVQGVENRFLPATVLTDVTPDMPIMNAEVFGPVVAALPFKDDAEALRLANRSSYGLTGSVWSRNSRRARRLACGINAGAVMINDHLMSHGLAETPWGGFGDSGIGRTHGELGFREMLKVQVIVDDILPLVKRNLFWHPYTEKVYRGVRAIAEFLGGQTAASRLKALPGVLRIFFRCWEK